MNISEQIIQILNTLCEKFGIVIDWADANLITQLESLYDRIIKYEICTSIFWIVFMNIITVIPWVIFGWSVKKMGETKRSLFFDNDDLIDLFNGIKIATMIIGTSMILPYIVVISKQFYDIFVANIIPEKIIFDFINNYL